MSPLVLLVFLAVALGTVGYMFNHALARLAFVELILTNGLPPAEAVDGAPGDRPQLTVFQEEAAAELLDPVDRRLTDEPSPGTIAVFASPSCLTCTMLVDELAAPDVDIALPIVVYYSGEKGPVEAPGLVLEQQQDLFDRLGVVVTPYVVVVRNGEVAAHGAVPNLRRFQSLLVTASLDDRLPMRLLGHTEDAST